MLYEGDIWSLIASWKNRLLNKPMEQAYKDALNDCIYDLGSLVDKQFEEEYTKLNNEYEEKIEELLIEQEKIFNKNEMLKAKCNALENYLKNYCKKANIDYDSLLSN